MVTNKDIAILDEFLKNRSVDYVLTGTAALYYHGLLPENTQVHDIDIIVLTTAETHAATMTIFKELEELSGCTLDNEHYEQKVYIFKIGENSIKVNAFESCSATGPYPKSRTFLIGDDYIRVHNALDALRAKFYLNRRKDHDFFIKLVSQLLNMFPDNV